MVEAASLYDNFCKTGNYVIYDVIIWVQDGNCRKWRFKYSHYSSTRRQTGITNSLLAIARTTVTTSLLGITGRLLNSCLALLPADAQIQTLIVARHLADATVTHKETDTE